MNRNQIFIFVGIGAIVLALVLVFLGILPGRKTPRPDAITLEFWSIESDDAWREIIGRFREKNPHITVQYKQLDEKTYEDILVNRIAEGRGPDVFMLHSSWIPKHKGKVSLLPENGFGIDAKTYRRFFIDIAANNLVSAQGEVLGLPLFVDTPALFYNRDTFNAAAITHPPTTWEEVLKLTRRLTTQSQAGDLVKSGITLGTFHNIERGYEVVNSLLLQSGDPIVDRRTGDVVLGAGAAEAFRLFLSFADPLKPNFSWSGRMQNSLAAFGEERAAMTFGFPADVARVRARNPHLSLRVAPLPQPTETPLPAVFGTYYFPAVSKQTRHFVESWQFLLFATSKDMAKVYLEKTGKAPARLDLIGEGAPSEELQVFYEQALIAKDWPTPDDTVSRRLFGEAIDSASRGAGLTPEDKINRLREQLRFLLP